MIKKEKGNCWIILIIIDTIGWARWSPRNYARNLNLTKWYMHHPESSLENKTYKLLWDFEIQTDYLISGRQPDVVIINKKKRACQIVDFAVPVDHWVKLKESEKKKRYLAREFKKTVEHKSDGYTNCNWSSWNRHQRINIWTGGLGNKRASGNHPNNNIIEIGKNIKESPGELNRLAVTQTTVRNHRLTLMWKTRKLVK